MSDEAVKKRGPGRPVNEEKTEAKTIRFNASQWERVQELKEEIRSRTRKSDGTIILDALIYYKKSLDNLNL